MWQFDWLPLKKHVPVALIGSSAVITPSLIGTVQKLEGRPPKSET
jgi:hypothetical protein